jgi:hypothetical protein
MTASTTPGMRLRATAAWLALVCVAAVAQPAPEAPPTTPPATLCRVPAAQTPVADYGEALREAKRADCLGHARNDPHPLVAQFNAQTDVPILKGQSARLLDAIDVLLAATATGTASGLDTETWQALLLELGRVRGDLHALPDSPTPQAWLDAVQAAIPGKWRRVASSEAPTPLAGRSIPLATPPAECVANTPCPAFQARLAQVRVANLMARLQRYAQDASLDQQFADSTLALGQWTSYRESGHHQYVWEVAANSALMGRDLCPEDAGTGMKMGFCKVPTSQLILLHPDAALRWSRTAQKAGELKPAVLLQVVGWYWWRWEQVDGRPTAVMADRRGVSLAATYTQSDTEQRWGYGPMFHYDRFNIAVTKAAGGKWSVVLNLNLAEDVFGRKEAFTNELASIRKTGFLDLLFR